MSALIQITPGMIEQLPCSSCTALCCGPVPISRTRLRAIHRLLDALPQAECNRLAKQRRGDLDCGFLDKETYRCTIYPIRPWVCNAFGRVEGMVCPVAGRLVQIIPEFAVQQQMEEETATPIVATSDRWNWKRMDFE